MNKKLKKGLILVGVFILFLSILFVIPSIDSYVSDQQTLEYQEYSKLSDNFSYEFKYKETYNYLEEIVTQYNKEFGYETENKILMGKGKKETVFAKYDEYSIIIYCEDIVNGKLTDNQIRKYLYYLIDSITLYEDEAHSFINDLIDYHDGMSVIMMPIIFETINSDMSDMYRVYKMIPSILNSMEFIIITSLLVYIIYFIIYILKNRKQENFIISKKKKVLFISSILFLILYILIGGLNGILSMLLNMRGLF